MNWNARHLVMECPDPEIFPVLLEIFPMLLECFLCYLKYFQASNDSAASFVTIRRL